jgi:hypothetical protein
LGDIFYDLSHGVKPRWQAKYTPASMRLMQQKLNMPFKVEEL